MTLQQIAEELKKQAQRWHDLQDGKIRLKYREPHPATQVAKLLHQAYMKFSLPVETQQLCQKLEQQGKGLIEQADYVDDIQGQSNYHSEVRKYNTFVSQFLEDIRAIAVRISKASEVSLPKLKTKEPHPITIREFIKRYCEHLEQGILDSRIAKLQELHRNKKITLPKIRKGTRGQADLYDEDKLKKNWPKYQLKMPNPINLRTLKSS